MAKSYFFSNKQIAVLLREVAAAYTIKNENIFRISAYEDAAASVEHAALEVKDAWDNGSLDQIPGVGKAISGYLDELFRTGKVRHFTEVKKKLPPAMFVFLDVPGVGAKTAYALSYNLGIISRNNAIVRLKRAAKEGKIRKLENFGETSEKHILQSIELLEKGLGKTQRMLLPYAYALANEVIDYLKKCPAVIEADPLGSLRRMVATVGDVDISVSTRDPKKVLAHFFKYPGIDKVLGKGEKALGRVILKGGQQVDLRLSSSDEYGSMLQYFTGSKQHNILLRELALRKGFSLSEYGIKEIKKRKIKTKKYNNEKDFYQTLGLAWIPPELREGTDEIEHAIKNTLPNLVNINDIKGDLHLHSNYPIEPSYDIGENNPTQMLQKAAGLGYQYLAFSEHNPSFSSHRDNQVIELIKKRNQSFVQISYSHENSVKDRGNMLPIKIFKSLEVDIKPNGERAISQKALELLDFAIVSIHSSFNLNKKEMTQRIINALNHPKVKILGHPTGRMLNKREGYEIDWDNLFDFCLRNGKVLEISSHPYRLDLPDAMVKEAVKLGVMLCVNSDAHQVEEMNLMYYGVSVARRGWAEKKSIINTLPLGKISDILLKGN